MPPWNQVIFRHGEFVSPCVNVAAFKGTASRWLPEFTLEIISFKNRRIGEISLKSCLLAQIDERCIGLRRGTRARIKLTLAECRLPVKTYRIPHFWFTTQLRATPPESSRACFSCHLFGFFDRVGAPPFR